MQLTRPRFTIRLLMILVAIVGMLLGAGIGAVGLVRRARHFRQTVSDHANLEKSYLVLVNLKEREVVFKQEQLKHLSLYGNWLRDLGPSHRRLHPDVEDDIARLGEQVEDMVKQNKKRIERAIQSGLREAQFIRSLATFHARMKQKYQRATSHPWETVPPDPPLPSLPPEPPESPAQPDPPPREPERRIEPRPLLTIAPGHPTGRSVPS